MSYAYCPECGNRYKSFADCLECGVPLQKPHAHNEQHVEGNYNQTTQIIGNDNHVTIEQQEGHKLLVQCTNEELYEERRHRQRLVSQVERKRTTIGFIAGAVLVINMLVTTGLSKLGVDVSIGGSLVTLVFLLGPLIVFGNLDKIDQEFLQRQLAVLREIAYILRERGDS